jgi:nicotinamidase-related amidase
LEQLRLGPLSAHTVHLCVDMQLMFAPGSPWGSPWLPQIVPRITAIAERAPERTVFTRLIPPHTPEDRPGMWQRYYSHWRAMTGEYLDAGMLDLMPCFARLTPPAHVVAKTTYSAFAHPALPHWLAKHGVDGLLVTGAETDVCILATVMGAVDFGYRVTIVTDAVCGSSTGGREVLFDLYHTRFCDQIDIADTETILRAWPSDTS